MKLADSVYIGSDNAIWWRGLQADTAPGTYITDATLTFHVFATQAQAIAYLKTGATTGSVANGTLSYVTDSNGDYRGVIEDSTDFTIDTRYFVAVKADAGSGRKDGRVLEYTARLRGTK